MKKVITILLFLSYTLVCLSQIGLKLNREYDYVGNEVNKAGLRVVGLDKTLIEFINSNTKESTVKRRLYGCVDKDGVEVLPIVYDEIQLNETWDYIIVGCKEPYGYEQKDGNIKCYRYYTSSNYLNYYGNNNYYYGLFSVDGKRNIIPTGFIEIIEPTTISKHGCVVVHKRTLTTDDDNRINGKKDKYGVYDSQGNILFQVVYDEIKWLDAQNGYLAVELNGRWNLFDYKGVGISQIQYGSIEKKGNSYFAVLSGLKWGVIDNTGKEILPAQFTEIVDCEDNIALVKENNIFITYNLLNGKRLFSFALFNISSFNGKSVWAIEKQSGKRILATVDGKFLNDMSGIFKKYNNKKRYPEVYFESKDGVKEVSIYDEKNDDERWIYYYYDDLGNEYTDFDLAKAANDSIRKSDILMIESNVLASINWHSSTEPVQDKVYNLVVSAQSRSDIQEVYLVVNGATHKDLGINKKSGHDLTIKKEIALKEGTNTIKVCVRNAAGTTQEERTILYRPQSDDRLVSIEWLAFDPSNEKNERLMKLGIKSKSKIEDVTITINGSQARGVKTVASDQYDMVIEHPITLVEGTNRIVVSVRNSEGIVTKERSEYYSDITPRPVFNDKRIALVIGNSDYSKPEMKLKNPVNDAQDIAKRLEKLGFYVILILDATLSEMNAALTEFELQAAEYDVALFYFAGHGIQSKGENYLLPTNIDYLTEGNVSDLCLRAGQVINQMDATKCKLKIAVLDACRNDPLSRGWHRGAGSRGLSSMDSPDGTIIAFSTAPGHTASDGTGRNSPYTESFLEVLDRPNLDIEVFFKKVGALVKNKTGKAQNPWVSSSNSGTFFFNPK